MQTAYIGMFSAFSNAFSGRFRISEICFHKNCRNRALIGRQSLMQSCCSFDNLCWHSKLTRLFPCIRTLWSVNTGFSRLAIIDNIISDKKHVAVIWNEPFKKEMLDTLIHSDARIFYTYTINLFTNVLLTRYITFDYFL